ncbi:MAG: AsmA family protein [Planctomycetes bacterium]|nr:AsmA family protein [Planctomycetota bacterium]
MNSTSPDPNDGARDAGREELLKTTAAPAPKKKKRWILRILLATPVLIALLVLMAPTILSTGPARRKIESAAAEATGRRVTLEDHSLGWWAPVSIQNFVMYEKDGTTPFLKVGSMVVKVDLLPLKEGNVVLRTLEISGVEVRIVKHRDGTLSTDDIGQKPPGASKAPEPKSDGKGGAFTMGAVTMKDVNVTYIDEGAEATYRITGLSLTAKPGASPDEIVAEIAAKVQSGSAPGGEVSIKATALALSGGKPRAEITADATVTFKGFDAAAMMPMKGVEWATGAVEGTVKAKLLAGGDVDASLDVKVPNFKWGDPGAVPLVVTYVAVKQDVGWNKKSNRVEFKQNGKIQMNGADVQAQGTIEFATDEHDTDNPVDLLVKFDAEVAKLRQLLPSSLADQDMRGPLRSNWTVKGKNLGKLDIQGAATVTSGQVPTDYTYQTHGEDGKVTWYKITNPGFLTVKAKGTMDLDRRTELAAKSPGRPWSSLDGLFMEVTVETPWIQSVDADVKQVLIDISLREQACDIRHMDFRLNDGDIRCTGTVAFDAEDPAWTFHTTVSDPPVKYSSQFSSVAALVNPALYSDQKGQVEAAMAWDIALKARGFAMDPIKKTVEGEGTLGLRNISLAGSPLFTELYSKLQLTKQSKFQYSLMDQKFHIKSGKIYNDFSNWQGDDKAANITISGETDFDGNLKQKITVTGDPSARWGKKTGAVVDVFNKAGGLPLGGTVSSPKIDIDYEQALKGVATGVLENPEVKEKVDDLLNDIFKKKKKK